VDWPDYHVAALAMVGYREARGEGEEGIRAVMHVVRNRVLSGWGDWDAVITGKNQFSSFTILGDSQTIVWPKKPTPLFDTCMKLATVVYAGSDPDPTNGATFYYNPDTATSKWFIDNVVAKREKVATLGHHVFFK